MGESIHPIPPQEGKKQFEWFASDKQDHYPELRGTYSDANGTFWRVREIRNAVLKERGMLWVHHGDDGYWLHYDPCEGDRSNAIGAANLPEFVEDVMQSIGAFLSGLGEAYRPKLNLRSDLEYCAAAPTLSLGPKWFGDAFGVVPPPFPPAG